MKKFLFFLFLLFLTGVYAGCVNNDDCPPVCEDGIYKTNGWCFPSTGNCKYDSKIDCGSKLCDPIIGCYEPSACGDGICGLTECETCDSPCIEDCGLDCDADGVKEEWVCREEIKITLIEEKEFGVKLFEEEVCNWDCVCNNNETEETCPVDCVEIIRSLRAECGVNCNFNFICDQGEEYGKCLDCGFCGDLFCQEGETNCPEDCEWSTCGDGLCNIVYGEYKVCPEDCNTCGDFICSEGEDCDIDCVQISDVEIQELNLSAKTLSVSDISEKRASPDAWEAVDEYVLQTKSSNGLNVSFEVQPAKTPTTAKENDTITIYIKIKNRGDKNYFFLPEILVSNVTYSISEPVLLGKTNLEMKTLTFNSIPELNNISSVIIRPAEEWRISIKLVMESSGILNINSLIYVTQEELQPVTNVEEAIFYYPPSKQSMDKFEFSKNITVEEDEGLYIWI